MDFCYAAAMVRLCARTVNTGLAPTPGAFSFLKHSSSRSQPGSRCCELLNAVRRDERSRTEFDCDKIASCDHSVDSVSGQRLAFAAERFPGFIDAECNWIHDHFSSDPATVRGGSGGNVEQFPNR